MARSGLDRAGRRTIPRSADFVAVAACADRFDRNRRRSSKFRDKG
jgi:hypothetical protein